jgi:peptide/nickel transport system permease protein
MFAYALRRILQFIPTIIGISLIMFLLLNVLPGNAALMAGGKRELDPQLIERLKKKWGLDKPLHIRYLTYMKDLAHGDLGVSFLRHEKVNKLIAPRIWPSFKLAVAAMLIALILGIPLGFYSALRQGTWLDTSSMVAAVSGVSLPQFWLGLLLMLFFSAKLHLFPTSGYGDGDLMHLVLPAVTLGVGYMALLARTTRAAVLEILEEDYIRTARSKGLSELLINRKHVLQNTLILILTTIDPRIKYG